MQTIMINGMEIYGDKEPHGPQRFGAEVVNALDKLELQNAKIQIVVPKSLICDGLIPNFQKLKVVGLDFNLNSFKGRFRFSKFKFSEYVKKNNGYGVDLVLSYPLHNCNAICLFDCIIKEALETYKSIGDKLWRIKYLFFEQNAINNANLIITISNRSKEQIIKDYHVCENKIVVCGTGYEHINRVKADYSILKEKNIENKKYYFSAGVGSGRKNFKWITSAAKNNPNSIFVIAGSSGMQLVKELEADGLDNLIIVGYVTDEQYKAILENCVAYIQPSFDEGFGIPPLEALALGKKAIVSDIPIFHEVYENAVYYIDPNDYNFCDLDDLIKLDIENAAKILQKYSWSNISKIILENIVDDIKRSDKKSKR